MLRIILNRRGVSNVIVVMLSLILVAIIVGNVFFWNFQMNQFDWERMQESMEIVDVRNSWSYGPSKYILRGSTELVSGSLSNAELNDGVYAVFRSHASASSSQTLFAHAEATMVGGTSYYIYKFSSADGPATALSVSMDTVGRHLWGKFVYPLSGITVINSSIWTFYYRAWRSGENLSSEIAVLTPNGAGTYTEWTGVYPSGIEHWRAVNDAVPDEDSTYIQTATLGYRDTFRLTDIPNSRVVSSVKVYARARRTTSSSTTFNLMIRTHNADFFSGSFSPTSSYAYYSYTWIRNPSTGAYWTIDELNDLEAGVECSLTRNVRVTQIYIEVEFMSQYADGHADVDIRVLRSDGSVRQVIATNVAESTSLTVEAQTLSGDYFWPEYAVVDETDYLEITYYCHVTAASSDVFAFLRIDDDSLAVAEQTKVSNVVLPSKYTLEVEFEGTSNLYDWSKVVWSVDGALTISHVNVTLQLYNYSAGEFATSGEGYIFYISSASIDELKNQTIITNPASFRDAHGNWKMKAIAVRETSVQFDFKIDWIEFKPAIEGVLLTFRNRGSVTVHLVSLWIINYTDHRRYDINVYVNSGETLLVTLNDVFLPDNAYIVKVITERGNIAVFQVEDRQ